MTYWLHIFLFNISDSFDYFIVSEKPDSLSLMSTELINLFIHTGLLDDMREHYSLVKSKFAGVFLPQQHVNP